MKKAVTSDLKVVTRRGGCYSGGGHERIAQAQDLTASRPPKPASPLSGGVTIKVYTRAFRDFRGEKKSVASPYIVGAASDRTI